MGMMSNAELKILGGINRSASFCVGVETQPNRSVFAASSGLEDFLIVNVIVSLIKCIQVPVCFPLLKFISSSKSFFVVDKFVWNMKQKI